MKVIKCYKYETKIVLFSPSRNISIGKNPNKVQRVNY